MSENVTPKELSFVDMLVMVICDMEAASKISEDNPNVETVMVDGSGQQFRIVTAIPSEDDIPATFYTVYRKVDGCVLREEHWDKNEPRSCLGPDYMVSEQNWLRILDMTQLQ